jgi:hypothetical protein
MGRRVDFGDGELGKKDGGALDEEHRSGAARGEKGEVGIGSDADLGGDGEEGETVDDFLAAGRPFRVPAAAEVDGAATRGGGFDFRRKGAADFEEGVLEIAFLFEDARENGEGRATGQGLDGGQAWGDAGVLGGRCRFDDEALGVFLVDDDDGPGSEFFAEAQGGLEGELWDE